MKKLSLNRNVIKIVAMVCMFIDHTGVTFEHLLPNWLYTLFRIIGRLALPLFAYFIAEGYFYTKNKLKYSLTLLTFGFIYQTTYNILFLNTSPSFNVLYSFALSTLIMFLYNKFYREQSSAIKTIFCFLLVIFMLLLYVLNLTYISISFGLLGILLPFFFYVFKTNKPKQIASFIILITLNVLYQLFKLGFTQFNNYLMLVSLLSIPFIILYSGKKGKLNLKYVFYWFYPLHRIFLYLIALII